MSDISDVKVMSSTIVVIFAITWVVYNYNIRTKFFERNRTKLIHNRIRVFFKNQTETEANFKKSIPHIPI